MSFVYRLFAFFRKVITNLQVYLEFCSNIKYSTIKFLTLMTASLYAKKGPIIINF